MSTDDTSTPPNNRSIETALTQLLHTAQPDGDLQGTYTLPALSEEQPAYTVEITVEDTADERPQQHRYRYCLDCDWTVSTAEYSRAEANRQMVSHATETGHDIESIDRMPSMGTGGTD